MGLSLGGNTANYNLLDANGNPLDASNPSVTIPAGSHDETTVMVAGITDIYASQSDTAQVTVAPANGYDVDGAASAATVDMDQIVTFVGLYAADPTIRIS